MGMLKTSNPPEKKIFQVGKAKDSQPVLGIVN